MEIIGAGLKYRKITVVLFILLIIAGVSGFLAMPRYEDPQFKISTARVLTLYPGAAPDQVEALITKPLEEKIKELEDVKTIESSSYNGVSSIIVKLNDNADQDKSWDKLRQKVTEASAQLPSGADTPEVQDDLNKTSFMIMHLTVPQGEDPASLKETVDHWEDTIKQVSGVERVEVKGLPDEQVQVILDPAALSVRRLSWTHVADSLEKRNVSIPGGILREGKMGFWVESSGEYRSLEDIRETIIYQPPGGAAVKVKDVAKVEKSPARANVLVETNGKPSVAIAVFTKEGYSVSSVEKDIQSSIDQLKGDLPPGVEPVVFLNQSESVQKKFGDLWRELLIGMVAVLMVCLLGLNWLTAIIVALSIPISAAVGFGPLSLAGVSLHQVTIAALIIALGILVDDAIVVNDNIERHLAAGAAAYNACLGGTREVAVPILTATVATVSAFAPLMLIPGDIGRFVYSLPVVVSVTMLASMVTSLWLTPTMRFWLLKRGRAETPARPGGFGTGLLSPALERLSLWYEGRLTASMKRPVLTVAVALLLSVGAFSLLPLIGVQLFPYAEREEFVIDIVTPRVTASIRPRRWPGMYPREPLRNPG
ncbi:acriflavin resistance protein [Desulfocucumis palustris]|uniref:Acriflavin resistance protein n=1 Tax=Desulfocucumis palustris TaxID=1898651 RepID=A0A2L2XBK9_9FIRM|nr:efflux RND transporter permease subunit [Desulfocucumis palustris]GBF33500.1 acriflavin resistance protein [Desulfocucumis palustris]